MLVAGGRIQMAGRQQSGWQSAAAVPACRRSLLATNYQARTSANRNLSSQQHRRQLDETNNASGLSRRTQTGFLANPS